MPEHNTQTKTTDKAEPADLTAQSISTDPSLRQDSVNYDIIGDCRVYIDKQPYTAEKLMDKFPGMQVDIETQVHLLRHFQSIPEDYRASLVGETYERKNYQSGETDQITVTDELIDNALATVGSKFNTDQDFAATPLELAAIIRDELIVKASDLQVYKRSFADVIMMTIDMPEIVGQDGVISTDGVEGITQEKRGKLADDYFYVNIARGQTGTDTSQIAVVIGIIEDQPSIFMAAPGKLTPDFPNDQQISEQREFSTEFWSKHAFVA